METWHGTLYLCKAFHGEIRKREKPEEPVWLKIDDVLEGKYKMPRMSSEYSSFIRTILRNQTKDSVTRLHVLRDSSLGDVYNSL